MKRFFLILLVLTLLFSFAACGIGEPTQSADAGVQPKDTAETSPETQPETQPETAAATAPAGREEPSMRKIKITVAETSFSAVLCDNAAAKALFELLPLTLQMNELNGNEKYYYLGTALPADAKRPDGIRAGDLMLYGDDCLVLFYESFSTAYRYTPLGYLDDPTGLAAALGSGGVRVTFEKG